MSKPQGWLIFLLFGQSGHSGCNRYVPVSLEYRPPSLKLDRSTEVVIR